ncbi:MAG TPA: DUF5663 domain-containing protein [Candidatus Saccharimonadales bacterium]|nr:DUF5663 domain-containing protein [Candidatus Saccharimonadales bacterium]
MQVDDQFLQAMGLDGLENDEKAAALDDILYTLNMRVGKRVAEILNDKQAAQFEAFSDDTSNEEIAKWLKENVPNYDQIVEEEAQKMKAEVQATVKQVMDQL